MTTQQSIRKDHRLPAAPSDTELVQAAREGKAGAWDQLVDQYAGLVWHVIRSFRLENAAAEDASQVVWLKAIEHLDQVRNPERIGSWLATTARNAAIAEWRKGKKQLPVGSELDGYEAPFEAPDHVVEDEERRAVTEAFASLSPEDQELLQLSVIDPAPSYDALASALSRPIGSIGPSRGRALTRLRRKYDALLGTQISAPPLR